MAVLRSEVAAFYAGFGQPELMRRAFEQAVVLVPVAEGDRVPTFRVGEIDWICAFTAREEFARFMAARGDVTPDGEYRFQSLLGSRLREYAAARPEPTGISIDCVGVAPIAFAPEIVETNVAEGQSHD
ncbi:hypothetical protein ACIRRA_41960 [Nocardia sp. NPDC101769]|uniref:hypothetical protein n=1 Tax=Nocardia sp. NPDC101769 TaxID=3364333 RepID=UPI0037F79F82